ncbi:MAG: HlyC/CorC family transporter [Myxococcales bacterium]|nr:HlyC/CorC family transporter [Myxococcales bacterium]MCB9532340.1 HlyC/CorC family transporter [Myxococcales bacterium]
MSDSTTAALGIVACLVGSAFFSGAETALTGLDRMRTRRLIDTGGRGARALELWLKRPAELLTTILIFNNIVNITASALATQFATSVLADAALPGGVSPIAVAVGVMTFLLLTFGEITPKTVARAHADALAPLAVTILKPLYIATRPINAGFVALSSMISRVDTGDAKPFVSEEDLGYLFELGGEEGSIPGDQAEILDAVLELDDKLARDVMVPRDEVIAVPISMGFDDLLAFIVDAGHSRVPVFMRTLDTVVGVVYAKDLLALLATDFDRHRFHIRDILRRVEFTPADRPIDALLRQMKDRRSHLAVVREERRTVGVVTLEDIIETLIGEVFDEYDDEEAAEYLAALRDQSVSEDLELDHDGATSIRPGIAASDDDDDDGGGGVAIRPGVSAAADDEEPSNKLRSSAY